MGNKAGKIWGSTELIEANGSCEFHRIDFIKGGTCSKHKHEFKWNGFYVMSGEMKIRVWQKDYDLVDETILKAGDFTAVKPGLYHSFEGIESGVAFEFAYALKKPVIFVDTDRKIKNVDYDKIGIESFEYYARETVGEFFNSKKTYTLQNINTVNDDEASKSVFSLGKSGKVASEYILKLMK